VGNFYRNTDGKDFVIRDGKVYISPKKFNSNIDSTATSGIKSFWFNEPMLLSPFSKILVYADVDNQKMEESKMRFTFQFSYGINSFHELPEYTINEMVEIKKIFINYELYSDSYEVDCLTGQVVIEDKIQDWCEEIDEYSKFTIAGIQYLESLGVEFVICDLEDIFEIITNKGYLKTEYDCNY